MSILEAIVLGIVQGLTEFLPVSSSGHLQIAKEVLGVQITDNLAFDMALHLATVLATVVVLWGEVKKLVVNTLTGRSSYGWKILLSAVPVAVVGLLLADELNAMLASRYVLVIVGAMLLVTAALLFFAQRATTMFTRKSVDSAATMGGGADGENISWRDSFIIGIGQAFAAMPGLSRSGTTISTGLMLGNQRAAVARFSFLMVIVPIVGNMLLDVIGGDFSVDTGVGVAPLIAGFVAAFVVGCAACRWMIALVKRARLTWFAIYCAVVGAATIVYSLI